MSQALYRRYRPETFADVIGQEHVTEPLMQALRSGRVNHAYLFSGPRGCGKTTSARILARCLNCEQGPTPEPCGVCDSCVALARGGSGTVDVIEIDAASHGGVDDARDLRERASYGPAQSRYKIYIIDEAHMVTPQGFNALLKIVEEPPEHVKFIFATTEPEKVIGTIRSRTHHYPFHLVPPARLSSYMEELCEREGIAVAPGVLSFVTRAGGGSVRDSLSVLDQLIAGSGDEGLTYEGAASLLGFTDSELLDATIDALAAGDAGAVFRQIDRVVESGHDPRRFIEDLLERLRDLIIVAALPEGAAQVLRGIPEDQLERMRIQQAAFGAGALTRAADIANAGLTEMTGATAPRLQLELICARILLPGSAGEQGYAARLDRLERRLEMGGVPSGASGSSGGRASNPGSATPSGLSANASGAAQGAGEQPESVQGPGLIRVPATPPDRGPQRPYTPPPPDRGPTSEHSAPTAAAAPPIAGDPTTDFPSDDAPTAPAATAGPTDAGSAAPDDAGSGARRPGPSEHDDSSGPAGSTAPTAATPAAPAAAGGLDTDAVRRAWPDVLDRVFGMRRATWTIVSQHAHVVSYDGTTVTLGFTTGGLTQAFRTGVHPEVVRQALIDAIGVDARVDAITTEGGGPGSPAEPIDPGDGQRPSVVEGDTSFGGATISAPPEASNSGTVGAFDGARAGDQAGDSAPGAQVHDLAAHRNRTAADHGSSRAGNAGSPPAQDWSQQQAPPPDWASGPVPTATDHATSAPAAPPAVAMADAGAQANAVRAELAKVRKAGAARAVAVADGVALVEDESEGIADDDEQIGSGDESGLAIAEKLLGGRIMSDDRD